MCFQAKIHVESIWSYPLLYFQNYHPEDRHSIVELSIKKVIKSV